MKLTIRTSCIFGILALLLSLPPGSALAASGTAGRTGLGVILGEPTGFSVKHWTTGTQAIDGGLAYSFNDRIQLFADYLWHDPGLFGRSSEFVSQLAPYVGVGLLMAFSTDSHSRSNRRDDGKGSDFRSAIRVPFGIEWLMPRAPVGLGIELVPGMKFVPDTDVIFQGGFLARYYL